jgi:hypothetical protein
MLAEDVKSLILRDRPGINVCIVPAKAMVTMDHRMDRVRLFVDGQGRVTKPPKIG